MRTLNIGFLGNQISPGGGAASLLLMVRALDKNLFNVFVITADCASEKSKAELAKHAKVVKVDRSIKQFVSCAGTKPGYRAWAKAMSNRKQQAAKVVDFIRQHDIDILHINNAVFSHLYQPIRQNTNVQIVSHIRERVHLYNRKWLQNFIVDNISRHSDSIITISDQEAEPFQHPSIKTIPNPFDFEKIKGFRAANLHEAYELGEGTLLVAMMGRFARDKGHMLFLEAAKRVIDKQPGLKVCFLIIGVSPLKKKWKRLAKRLLFREDIGDSVRNFINKHQLQEQVRLVPYTSEVLPLIMGLDLFVRPSLFADPWGRDIIECMAVGKCVVATGDHELFVQSGKTGYLTGPPNTEKLAGQLELLLKDEPLRKKLGENAKNHIHTLTDLNDYGNRIKSVYESLIPEAI